MSAPNRLLNPKERVLRAAALLANKRAREELLGGAVSAKFLNSVSDLTGSSLATLKQEWNPFEPDWMFFGYRLRLPDDFTIEIMKDEDLHAKAVEIGRDSVMQVLTEDQRATQPFLQDLLQTLIDER